MIISLVEWRYIENMVIIGSEAIKYWYPDFPRTPKDLDVIVEKKDEKLELTGSYSKIERLENPVLLKWHKSSNKYLKPDYLYTLKISHVVGWKLENNSYEKHLWDIGWLKEKGCKLNLELFNELYQYWNKVHGKNKRSDLAMSSEDFFNNAMPKDLPPHDYLHTLLNPIPTYTKVLIGEVEVGEEKFNSLSFEEKKALVMEEVMIMSWERKFHKDYRISYGRMLRKFILNHAPLWEAIWIAENFKSLYKPEFDYFKLINEKLKENELQPI